MYIYLLLKMRLLASVKIQCMSDFAYAAPNIKMAKIFYERGISTWLSEFDHRSSLNPTPESMGTYRILSLNNMFGTPFTSVQIDGPVWQNYTEEDRHFSLVGMTLISEFVKYG